MIKTAVAGVAFATVLALIVLPGHYRALEQNVDPVASDSAGTAPTVVSEEEAGGFLYGRVTTADGAEYLGRLRFGRDQEAFWGDYFNGMKAENPWAMHVPADRRPEERPITIFGFELPFWRDRIDLGRPFMARFGDIVRIEARSLRHIRVTLKSGTVFDLNRNAANDFDDGVRVWDEQKGVVDLASWAGGLPPPSRIRVRAIDLLPTTKLGATPVRLHGAVRTRHGDFSGFVQWDRQECVGLDELVGHTDNGPLNLRFDTIRTIARNSDDSVVVTLHDGREFALPGTRAGRGIYVEDPRYGRVLISWGAFERIDFDAAGSGPAYDEFVPGRPLRGSVITRSGRRLTGRLVYDLDESETTETLDAPSHGVDYTIPFALVASITPSGTDGAEVTLQSGEKLQLDRAGDLGAANAGVLIFVDGRERAEYVPWSDVERVDVDRPSAK